MPMGIEEVVWRTLSSEGQTALQIVQRVKETGETLSRASWHLTGQSWKAARLESGLTSVTEAMSQYGVTCSTTEALVAEGTELAASATAAGGGVAGALGTIGSWLGLSGTAATLAGAAVVTAVLAVPTYFGAKYLGAKAADGSVALGPAALNRQGKTGGLLANSPTTAAQGEPFFVLLAGNDVFVARESVLKAKKLASVRGWGLDRKKTVGEVTTVTRWFGPFDNSSDAIAAAEENMTPNPDWGGVRRKLYPLGVGWRAKFGKDGKIHSIDNLTRFVNG